MRSDQCIDVAEGQRGRVGASGLRRTVSVVACAAFFLGALGCCPHRYEAPVSVLTQPDVALKRMRARAGRVQSLELLTRMSMYSADGAQKGAVEVLARRPAQLRFEALAPAGRTLAVVASDGRRFMSHERGKPECFVGEACAANVSRLLPVAFDGAQLLDLFAGAAPVLPYATASLEWGACEGVYVLTLQNPKTRTRQVIWLEPDTFHALKSRVERSGALLFEITFEDFGRFDGEEIPRRLRFESPDRDTDLQIDIREAYLNGVDSELPFAPVCPQGTRQRELPCR